MPRAKKGHACLNIKIDAALYRKLMEVSEEAGQTIALLTKAVTPLQQVYNRHRR